VKNTISSEQTSSKFVPLKLQAISSEGAINTQFTMYTVRSGDSLFTIAKQFAGVSGLDIKLLNNIKNARSLVPGQKLKIPVKA